MAILSETQSLNFGGAGRPASLFVPNPRFISNSCISCLKWRPLFAFFCCRWSIHRSTQARPDNRVGDRAIAVSAGAGTHGRGGSYIFRAGGSLSLLLRSRIGCLAICADSESIRPFLAPGSGHTVRSTQNVIQQAGVFSRAAGVAIAALSTTQGSQIARISLCGISGRVSHLRCVNDAHSAHCG